MQNESKSRDLLMKTRIAIFVLLTLLGGVVSAADNKFNLRTTPVSDAFGIVNIDLDYAVSKNITLGPTLTYFDYEVSDITFESTMFGVRLNYFFNEALAGGMFASFGGSFGNFDISEVNTSNSLRYSSSSSVRIYTALLGYQAMWDNFNITFGGGASYISLPETVLGVNEIDTFSIDTSTLSGVVPNVELTMGWSF
jgi:hypothetical protein